MASVAKVGGAEVRTRRALSEDEITKIIANAPPERRFIWELLLSTGLRVQEAADLQWQDVRTSATQPYLLLRAMATKSRRQQSVPLRSDIAEKFRNMCPENVDPSAKAFPVIPRLKDWRKDLAASKVDWKDGAGRQVDRHALRLTFGTRLQKAGVAPRVAMELMRHSDMRLTMKVYTDPTVFDLAGAIESLPAIKAPVVDTVKTAATGS